MRSHHRLQMGRPDAPVVQHKHNGERSALVLVLSGSRDHHDRIAAGAGALVLASRRSFGKHAARIRLALGGEAELSTHRLLEVVDFVLSGNRDSDARSATAKQDSLADAAYRWLINPA